MTAEQVKAALLRLLGDVLHEQSLPGLGGYVEMRGDLIYVVVEGAEFHFAVRPAGVTP